MRSSYHYEPLELDREFEFEVPAPAAPPGYRAVRDTTAVPFRFICALTMQLRSQDGKQSRIGRGSGTLISNRHVLTCAHNFKYKDEDDPSIIWEAQSIAVAPGKNTSAAPFKWTPFGSHPAAKWDAHPTWKARFNPEYDFGLITLKKDIGLEKFGSIGNKKLGYWGGADGGRTVFRDTAGQDLRDLVVNVGGYPEEMCGDETAGGKCLSSKRGGTQYCAYDKITDPKPAREPLLIYYKIPAKKGQSGAPVWHWHKPSGERRLVAIHTAIMHHQVTGDYLWNTGIRITHDVRKKLYEWGWNG